MKQCTGFSLIEVLISLVILSVALLGFDVFQLFAIRQTLNAYYLNVAQEQMLSMAQRLKAHPSRSDLPHQVVLWNQENQKLLPAGKGYVSKTNAFYRIILFWGKTTSQKTCPTIKLGELNCLSIPVAIKVLE